MNLNDAKSVPFPRKRSFRVGRGRGSGWGKTSRRGHKGAASRTGWGGGIMREGGQMPLARRLPKKGFGNSAFRVSYEVVNLERLSSIAVDGRIDPDVLKGAGLIKKSARWVKILGDGEPGAALKVTAHHFSKGAREKIEKAGGTVTVLPGRHGKPAEASKGERHAYLATKRIEEAAKRARFAPKKKPKDEAAGAEAVAGEKGAPKGEGKAEKRAEKKAERAVQDVKKAEKKVHDEKKAKGDAQGGHKPGHKPGNKPGKKAE
jgi:large subunit ribosomal protein L15